MTIQKIKQAVVKSVHKVWFYTKVVMSIGALVSMAWIGGGAYERHQYEQEVEALQAGFVAERIQFAEDMTNAVVAEREQAYRLSAEVNLLARILVGEARGQREEWMDIVSAFFARVDDSRWANSIERVALEDCEIDALCDRVPEYLDSEIGREAIQFAREVLTAYYAGEFEPTHRGHSWATPAAAEGHAYFASLEVVTRGEGHQYFADPLPPESTLAPVRSRFPRPRPVQSVVLAEQVEQLIASIE